RHVRNARPVRLNGHWPDYSITSSARASGSLVRHNDRLHDNFLLGHLSLWWKCCSVGKPVRHLMPGAVGRSRPIWTALGACRSRTNADDRLPLASLGPVEGGDGVVEGRDVADVRPQSSVTHPLDDLTQLGAIGHENKVDRQAVGG